MFLLALFRGVQLAVTLSAFGALLFRTSVAPAALVHMGVGPAGRILQGLTAIVRVSIVVAFMAAVAWLPLKAEAMSGAENATEAMAAVPIVLLQTVFGHALALRLLLLGAALLVLGSGRSQGRAVAATWLAGMACIMQVGMGHPIAAGSMLLLTTAMAHVLAAGAWLGGLVPLWLMIRCLPQAAASVAARRFSSIGVISVGVLTAAAILQGWELIGGVGGLVGTAYGRLALAKSALFVLLVAIAAVNRQVFTPRLAREAPAGRYLERSIAAETALAMLVILAASSMAGLTPGSMRMARDSSSADMPAGLSDDAGGTRRRAASLRSVPTTSLAAGLTDSRFTGSGAGKGMLCS